MMCSDWWTRSMTSWRQVLRGRRSSPGSRSTPHTSASSMAWGRRCTTRRSRHELDQVTFRSNVEVCAVPTDVIERPEVIYADLGRQEQHTIRPRFMFVATARAASPEGLSVRP